MPTVKWRIAESDRRVSPPVLPWSELPSLHELFPDGGEKLTDEQVKDEEAHQVARRYLRDVNSHGRATGFIREMIDAAASQGGTLSAGQTRGVLNVLGGNIRAHRRRFWKSRPYRRDADRGYDVCLVCGGPLNDDTSTYRGLGPVCYRSVVEGWSG